jgi:hypothetical protein
VFTNVLDEEYSQIEPEWEVDFVYTAADGDGVRVLLWSGVREARALKSAVNGRRGIGFRRDRDPGRHFPSAALEGPLGRALWRTLSC